MGWILMLVLLYFYSTAEVISQSVTQSEQVTPTTSNFIIVDIFAGEPFSLWCNFSTSRDLSAVSFSVKWRKEGNPWCAVVSAKVNTTTEECVKRGITQNNVYNPSGTQNFQLNIPKANISDSGNYTCALNILGDDRDIVLSTVTIVVFREMTTFPVTSNVPPSITSTSKDPTRAGLSKETIIVIGAGAGGGVLLITVIIVAVTCVKKKSKGNSTSDIDQKKVTSRKNYPMEQNVDNVDDRRKSNPLEKNVENIHYADLALHDNPKSSSSKRTGSAKSKTLTVNPSDDRVEYAAVMAS